MSVDYPEGKPIAKCDGPACRNRIEIKPLDPDDLFSSRDVVRENMPTLTRLGWTRSGNGLLYCKFCTNKLRMRRDRARV
jgi:hypothetical protein